MAAETLPFTDREPWPDEPGRRLKYFLDTFGELALSGRENEAWDYFDEKWSDDLNPALFKGVSKDRVRGILAEGLRELKIYRFILGRRGGKQPGLRLNGTK